MRPDPTTLALFVAAVEEGTIAAAAVSTRLSELEDQLGTRLLRPSNKAIEATAAGVALLGLARAECFTRSTKPWHKWANTRAACAEQRQRQKASARVRALVEHLRAAYRRSGWR